MHLCSSTSSTHLTERVFELIKDLTSLHVNVDHLKEELEARKDQSDEDLGIEWEAINGSLKVISNYLNNGGFVNDLAGWGIDIKGFDVQSVKTLGIDVDENTARLLKMKPIENPTVPSLFGVKPLFSDQLPNGRPPIFPTRTPKTKFWWPKNDVWPPVVSGR
ncbi:hypothetical protein Tcan_08899 [Toxocara canis]|uniref:Uncharacterized protein n=1 Tax=Toxocara canis TaxID=6265 RepID=A0A0B2W4C6_TOXCA|nr:hypothetical protein Tcan_08899 [Toxocara canis]